LLFAWIIEAFATVLSPGVLRLGKKAPFKEEEVWLHEYQSLAEARDSIARWIHQYNHQRPHQALHYRTPAAARQAFHQPQPLTKTEALSV
jgi:transposase InsO family protein